MNTNNQERIKALGILSPAIIGTLGGAAYSFVSSGISQDGISRGSLFGFFGGCLVCQLIPDN